MYIIQEIQTTNDTTAITPANIIPGKQEAESAYLFACGAACVSNVDVHTVICMDEHGNYCFGSPKYYEHLKQI